MEQKWTQERKELLRTIQRQQEEYDTLRKRFKKLQRVLVDQQQVLDKYHRAFQSTNVPTNRDSEASINLRQTPQDPELTQMTQLNVATAHKDEDEQETCMEDDSEHEGWTKRKVNFHETNTTAYKPPTEPSTPPPAASGKRKMAMTWADEKKRMRSSPSYRSKLKEHRTNDTKSTKDTGKEGESFAYVDVVRNRTERAALPAFDCEECRKYYEAIQGVVSPTKIRDECSRHRARYQPTDTPDDFWRLSFPDSLSEHE